MDEADIAIFGQDFSQAKQFPASNVRSDSISRSTGHGSYRTRARRFRCACVFKVNKIDQRKSAMATVGWEDLKSGIREAFSEDRVNVEQVKRLMTSYESKRSDWEQFEHFDKHK